MADADRDLAKIAVVERHLATGRIGLGFVAGSGLQRGALASSVAHDAHNLVVVGMSDRDMAFAVERLAELGGGIVAVEDLRVLAECPLPVAGLLSDAPLADVIAQSRACNEAARELGWSGATPFLTLAFLALSVIPHPQDHGSRPRRRRPLRARPARRSDDALRQRLGRDLDDAGTEHESGWLLVDGRRRSPRSARAPSPRRTSGSTSAARSSRPASSTRTTTCTRR